jgi:hypothetical protein
MELSPGTIEAIARRVAELLAGQVAVAPPSAGIAPSIPADEPAPGRRNDLVELVPLLPIKAPRPSKRGGEGRRREDLAQPPYGARWRSS